ncbi:bis(5'-nucleosyl)-tetraphosphatase (symmetrical) YqeK [Thermocoleostomius sinensis]|nr:bis(5'-nucleosyl)-tetraphosphatase (symmetrical) YqeK [Thermocoleostomius sinensis]
MRQQVLAWLADNVPESRIKHVLRVEQMAISLAQIHELDVGKAAQSGLMHDLAKYFKPQQLLEIAHREGWTLDPVDELNPHLLHADVSAVVARDIFGVEDQEILMAIANHTLGRPAMGPLSCVIFLSDSLEPGRGDTPELNTLRRVAERNLFQAVWMNCDYTLKYLIESRRLVHPRVLLTRNWFLQHSPFLPLKRSSNMLPTQAHAS